MSATTYASLASRDAKHFKAETARAVYNSTEAVLQRQLRRMFPALNVSVVTINNGLTQRVGFFASCVASFFGLPVVFGNHHMFDAPIGSTPSEVAGRILRTAYPRGWAQP